MSPLSQCILEILSVPGIGPARYWKLVETFGDAHEVLQAKPSALRRVLSVELSEKIANIDAHSFTGAAKVISWCEQNDVVLLSHQDEKYPQLLREIVGGPPLLYVKGDVDCLDQPQLAIIGSRSCSHAAQKHAHRFAAELADAGLCISSGLALGVDTQAHLGALSVGGKTIGVIGSGIDRVYPAKNRYLFERIVAEGGAIVSEFPLNTPPAAENFPRRNRIISGMSYGSLVVEATLRSGSLITARCALEQNREVFAIPGSIQNPGSRGCHALIKQGANLVESTADIVEHLVGFAGIIPKEHNNSQSTPILSDQEQNILTLVEHEPTSLETIADRSTMALGEILSILMSLELKGIICQNALGYTRI